MKKQTVREKILDNLKRTLVITQENDQICKRYRHHNREVINPSNLSTGRYMVLYFGLMVLIYLFVEFVNRHIILIDGIFLFVPLIPILILPYYILGGFTKKINRYFKGKRMEKNKEKIEQLILKYNKNLRLMDSHSMVPACYRSTYAVISFIQYIENLRADNLKEAINLFEHDRQHMQQMYELMSIKDSQDKIIEETKRAAYAAGDAEFAAWFNLIYK